ncbi:MAG: zinc ribbon domain-containing protein [Anaerolineae bacterium]|nr:zinc ribbon domain-containing protein [Anaerolineae bacterium]MDW8171244.1 FmdB family zinc ribbon protein [Anaerolineae bacterium]
MPMYTYRREDGTTFDLRQNFGDEPLTVCPSTGQRVVRVVQAAGVIFKGSGFYVTDNKVSSKTTTTSAKDGKAETPAVTPPPATAGGSAAAAAGD